MTIFTTLTRLAAMLFAGIVTIAAVDSAMAASDKPRHSAIRDHRGPDGAPSGGVKVDGSRVDIKPPKLCYGGRPCPASSHHPPARPNTNPHNE
jgi:hypothetical protein